MKNKIKKEAEKYIFLDLGNCDENSLSGKDLVKTNAPDSLLDEVSKYVDSSPDVGLTAEEVFVNQIKASGCSIEIISAIEDIEMYFASSNLY